MPKRFRPVPTAVLVLAVAVATLGAGCTGSAGSPEATAGGPQGPTSSDVGTAAIPAPAPSGRVGSTSVTPPVTTYPRPPVDQAPTAADSLAAFFVAAHADDERIRATAPTINREIGPNSVSFSRATMNAVKASAPERTARAIPAGMDADLLRATMIVYRDLAARAAAFNQVVEFAGESRRRTDPEVVRFLDGLRRGSLVARAYRADLAAARALAAATPPVRPAAPDSRAAAELAVWIAMVKLRNNGCNANGAPVTRTLVPIVWKTTVTPDGRRHDGSIGGIAFSIGFGIDGPEGGRWSVALDAC
jgi:hypothetical protein